ncbi:hypothetical protein FRC12_021230 [Ceratobasidium sp. 428]|nr:hypothetical protein FRC12_021230 [Ceratobasidium sp. 428]
MSLSEIYFFLVLSEIFTLDSERQIHDMHQNLIPIVDTTTPGDVTQNGMEDHPSFNIHGIIHFIDASGTLWFQIAPTGEWRLVWLYTRLEDVMVARMEFLEFQTTPAPRSQASLHTGCMRLGHTSNVDNMSSTNQEGMLLSSHHGASSSSQSNVNVSAPELYPSRSIQHAVDNWVEQYQKGRRVRGSQRLTKMACPVPGCDQKPRRPHALKEHLYFHFKIKPHVCGFCSKGFETVTNQKRHEKTCADAPQPGSANSEPGSMSQG